ncbi:GtrA family protein [Microbacterium radiodurans]|uniref:GtrA family protein n=1 Tax=Microbacterium radiodurans TaxID=661398 RepID=A0A5J5IQ59_9MICO|nr:GtrA family protein [Microbacterium radiodurans]
MGTDIDTLATKSSWGQRPEASLPEAKAAGEADSGHVARPVGLRTRLIGQLASFGLVGGLAFVVDLAVYNAVRATVLQDSPIWSKVVSVAVATAFAWLGNRYLTFRRERSPHAVREGVLFAVVNVVGLLIAAGCLFVSHYVLGFTSQLADNISGNGVGLVLGTAFRFAAYRWLVFSPRSRTLRVPRSARRIVRLDTGGPS